MVAVVKVVELVVELVVLAWLHGREATVVYGRQLERWRPGRVGDGGGACPLKRRRQRTTLGGDNKESVLGSLQKN